MKIPMDLEAAAEAHRLYEYRSDGTLVRKVASGAARVGSVVGSLKRNGKRAHGYRDTKFRGRRTSSR